MYQSPDLNLETKQKELYEQINQLESEHDFINTLIDEIEVGLKSYSRDEDFTRQFLTLLEIPEARELMVLLTGAYDSNSMYQILIDALNTKLEDDDEQVYEEDYDTEPIS